ncbi:MAG: succinate dehydrogenase cytochrome b subunit [Armatimonadetes bacterium]|nr:succinate dehydrogenase cytochrome b subunit [Armatimonadota bacterium]
MLNLAAALQSTVGRKLVMGLTGFVWFGYLLAHLSGNLLLFVGRDAFNGYAQFLTHTLLHGAAVWIFDALLVVTLLAHVWTGVGIWWRKNESRPSGYELVADAGGPSKKSWASQSMAYTGILILAFIAWHVIAFKFGENEKFPHYELAGEQVRDVYSIVVTAFQDPITMGIYVFIMLLIGIHLSHGVWSAFQSLGLNNSRFMPLLTAIGAFFAVVLAAGFLVLPMIVFLDPSDYFMQGVPR